MAATIGVASGPLPLPGGPVSRSLARCVPPDLERHGIPVMTTTSAIERLPSGPLIAAGRLDFLWCIPGVAEPEKGYPVIAAGFNASPDHALCELTAFVHWQDRDKWADYLCRVRYPVPILQPANEIWPTADVRASAPPNASSSAAHTSGVTRKPGSVFRIGFACSKRMESRYPNSNRKTGSRGVLHDSWPRQVPRRGSSTSTQLSPTSRPSRAGFGLMARWSRAPSGSRNHRFHLTFTPRYVSICRGDPAGF